MDGWGGVVYDDYLYKRSIKTWRPLLINGDVGLISNVNSYRFFTQLVGRLLQNEY